MSGRHATLPKPDLLEYGAELEGAKQQTERRLYMMLQVFTEAEDPGALGAALAEAGVKGVLYERVGDARGVGLLTWSEDPGYFLDTVQAALRGPAFEGLEQLQEFTMFGRTYALGHERDLLDWLIDKPVANVTGADGAWAVFYPLKRTGAFSRLDPKEQGIILREHGAIGRAYGEHGLAKDIRLASFGLDENDNDFTIGLVGKELTPLSHVVQRMRKTKQTGEYMERMGPFFVGRRVRTLA